MKRVGVIGEGAWGTAIAQVLADNGHDVHLWCCDPAVAEQINTEHKNMRYIPNFTLSKTICAHARLKDVITRSEFIFISTPTAFFRSIVMQCEPFYRENQVWVVLSKGIENESLKVPTQILTELLSPHINVGVLGGPSFAQEVMERQLTGVMVAAADSKFADKIAQMVANNYFNVFTSIDVLGVQLGGALKNVIALMMGVANGAHFGDNPRAFLFTRGWHELVTVASALGAQPQTLFDLPGLGDVFLTVTGKYSRNLAIGDAIGQGTATGYAQDDTCVLPEGINTIKSVKQLVDLRKIHAPLCQALYTIIFESAEPTVLLQAVESSVAERQKK